MAEQVPAISVVMPVYNGGKYLKQAIQSILDQSFSDFELIIVNDASTDNSAAVIRSFEDPRILFLENETNLRISRSLNRGIQTARAALIARMDQDDIAATNRLELQKRFLDQNPSFDIVGSWAEIISEDGVPTGRCLQGMESSCELRFWFQFNCYLAHPSVMYRKKTWERVGGYTDIPERQPEDFEFWTKALRFSKAANLPEKLLSYRETSAGMSRQKQETLAVNMENVAAEYVADLQGLKWNDRSRRIFSAYFKLVRGESVLLNTGDSIRVLCMHLKSMWKASDGLSSFVRVFKSGTGITRQLLMKI